MHGYKMVCAGGQRDCRKEQCMGFGLNPQPSTSLLAFDREYRHVDHPAETLPYAVE